MRLGQDVEVFLQDQAGKHISAIGFINAGKEDPFQIPDMAPGFTLQEDNVSLEYGMPPAASMEEWDRQIEAVMEKSKEFVQGLSFSRLSCAVFDQDQMMHPRAHIFGCQPDHDAWTGQCNPKPNPPSLYAQCWRPYPHRDEGRSYPSHPGNGLVLGCSQCPDGSRGGTEATVWQGGSPPQEVLWCGIPHSVQLLVFRSGSAPMGVA